MKQRMIFIILALFLVVNGVLAQSRSVTEAISVAESFLSTAAYTRSATFNQDNTLSFAYASRSAHLAKADKSNYYVFNRGANNGFIIVSGDDRAIDVLGYTDEGRFDYDELPPGLKGLLETYEKEIEALDNPQLLSGIVAPFDQPEITPRYAASYTINFTPKWNQNTPYNDRCPGSGSYKSVTGCVATAMAQIMYYHRHPSTGTGSKAYTTSNYGTVSANFGTTAYNFANMIPSYTNSATATQRDAVAMLMFHCGVAVEMAYSPNGSTGSSSKIIPALVNNFRYSNNAKYLYRSNYTNSEWLDLLKNEISAGRPVIYRGEGSSGGHAWVCYGYDSSNYFAMNWGWGGSSDGRFQLGALTPSKYNLNSTQAMVIGISPVAQSMSLSASPASISFYSSGGQNTFSITSNTSWTVRSSASWLSLSVSSGSGNRSVTASTTANTSTSSSRTATITISGSGVSDRTISVTQAAATPLYNLTVSPASFSYGSPAEAKFFSLTSNTSWTIGSSASWLTVSPNKGSGNGYIMVSATTNTSTSSRTATITLNGTGVTAKTMSVTQAGAPAYNLSVSPVSISYSYVGEQKSFNISSNTSWVASSSASWLSLSTSSSSGNRAITATAAANSSTSQRTATVTITGTGVPAKTINITQAAAPSYNLSVSATSINFSGTADEKSFNITSNTDWKVSSSQSWLTVSPSSGAQNKTITVRTTANPSTSASRTASVTVTGTGVATRTINVTQAAAIPTKNLTTSVTSLSLGADGVEKTFDISSNTEWTISNVPSWLTVYPVTSSSWLGNYPNRSISVKATPNLSTSQRTASLTISGTGAASKTVSVTQAGATTPYSLYVTGISDGSTFFWVDLDYDLTITSNTNWTVSSNASWLKVSPASGSNNRTVTLTTTENTQYTPRKATVTVSGTNVPAKTFNVTQEKAPYISASTYSLNFLASGETKTFTVTSSYDWSFDDEYSGIPSWLTVTPLGGAEIETGLATTTVTVKAAANTSASSREAELFGWTTSGQLFMTITQDGTATRYLTVSETIFDFACWYESEQFFSISSNTDWKVSSDASWVKVSPASGTGNGNVKLSVPVNTVSTSPRVATITVTGTGVTTKTLDVWQDEYMYVNVSPDSLNFSAAGGKETISFISNIGCGLVIYGDSYDYENPWITTSPGDFSFVENDDIITVNVKPNASKQPRTVYLDFVCTVGIPPVVITQAGAIDYTLTTSTSSLNYEWYEADEYDLFKTFAITSNTDWKVGSSAPWLTVSPSSGTGTDTVTTTVTANTLTTPRTATLTISGEGVSNRTINVTQSGQPNTALSTTSLTFSPDGETKTFSITSNTFWQISDDMNPWLSFSRTSGASDGAVTVTAEPNTTPYDREDVILITAMSYVGGIEVKQAAGTTYNPYVLPVTSLNAWFAGDRLRIVSPCRESIAIYSLMGVQLYAVDKPEGMMEIPLQLQPGATIIVKGSKSGAVKVFKSNYK